MSWDSRSTVEKGCKIIFSSLKSVIFWISINDLTIFHRPQLLHLCVRSAAMVYYGVIWCCSCWGWSMCVGGRWIGQVTHILLVGFISFIFCFFVKLSLGKWSWYCCHICDTSIIPPTFCFSRFSLRICSPLCFSYVWIMLIFCLNSSCFSFCWLSWGCGWSI